MAAGNAAGERRADEWVKTQEIEANKQKQQFVGEAVAPLMMMQAEVAIV
jgi:hypothetical protein